ncbi:MAG: hypothetical protein H6945_05015 [Zoogloeaceae bacterium]|nr:hypothetical protein [Rhodocyclaceae bacterium]MCP5235082.1 hypothetical protein [Zoogloeaceae bacterium]
MMAESSESIELSEEAYDPRPREFARLRARMERFDEAGGRVGDLAGIGRRMIELAVPLRDSLAVERLPLNRLRFSEAREAIDGALACARWHLRVLQEIRSPYLCGFRGSAEVLAGGLELLADAFELACLARISAPHEFWLTAHGLYLRAATEGCEPAAIIYKRLLALATIQPESFSSPELLEVFAIARGSAGLGELRNGEGEPPGQGWFWVDIAQDCPPVAIVRREPPPVDDLVFFSAAALARAASERLARDDVADLPEQQGEGAAEVLLRRLRERWAMPPRRIQPRRRSEYEIQVCAGLDEIWRLLVRGEDGVPPRKWTVQNESPGGFSIMQISSDDGDDLTAGMAVALRRVASAGWAVCVVRWIRNEQPGQVELGLQLVSQAAIPVRVAFRSGNSARLPVAALVLPPLTGVRRHQAVLAPAGTYSARRFMLVHDGDRLYVAQGRLLSLDMQTDAIELFQFEVDPYPI